MNFFTPFFVKLFINAFKSVEDEVLIDLLDKLSEAQRKQLKSIIRRVLPLL